MSDKSYTAYSPTGSEIIGVVEVVEGTALIGEFDRVPQTPEEAETMLGGLYLGETKMDWDTQTPKRDWNKRLLYVDDNAERWTFEQLSFR